jgi:hypothetical protein
MGHLIRVFGQDWYRLAAPERAGRPLGEVLPDWVDPRPCASRNRRPETRPRQTSGSSASSAAKCWSTGTKASSSTAPPRGSSPARNTSADTPASSPATPPRPANPPRRARFGRERREHKIWSAIYRRAGLQPWERDGVSRATWYRRSAKASKPEGGGEPDP